MIVAAPGVGKSVFANAYAVQSGVRTLYLSMDTDGFTTSVRLVAMTAGVTMAEAERGLALQEPWTLDTLSTIRNVTYAFPSNPSAEEVVHRLNAYREAIGVYPELLVIDNLQNIGVGEDEFGGQGALLRELQSIAMATQTCILVLHHATGEHDDGNDPLPQSGIRGKLSKFPALILTLYKPGWQRMGVSVVKNRFGPADPSGVGVLFNLHADMEKATILDVED